MELEKPMVGASVSRWTMPHFAAALSLFIAAQVAMVAGVTFPATSLLAPSTVAVVHLLTIGWLTLLMLGALQQFVPVIAAQGAPARASALVSLCLVLAGLAGMETGFLALGGHLPAAALAGLPLGGIFVLAGVATGAAIPARILWQTRPLPFSARFIAAGLAFLLVTVLMGGILGLTFAFPGVLHWPAAFLAGLRLHLLAGLGGWFTLTAMGVSYRLLSMFTLAPEDRGRLGIAVLSLTAGGLAAIWLLELTGTLGLAVPAVAIHAAAAISGAGIALYLFDIACLYRSRRRRVLELNTRMAAGALGALAVSLLLAAWLLLRGGSQALLGAVGYLLLFGWLSGLGLSQLYKIVPFLTWLERYGKRLGREPVPRVQDLVSEPRDRPWFRLYFVCVAAGTVCAALQWVVLWRLTIALQLAATLVIVRALWLVRHGWTQSPATSVRATFPTRGPAAARHSLLSQPSSLPKEQHTMTTDSQSTLDVREILKAGGEPFADIMKAVAALIPGQSLRLLATFKPVPLFSVMKQRGFGHTEREIGGGDWEVIFTPAAKSAA